MVWSLDMDDFSGSFCGRGSYPLLKKLNAALVANTTTQAVPATPTTPAATQPATTRTAPTTTFPTTNTATSPEFPSHPATTTTIPITQNSHPTTTKATSPSQGTSNLVTSPTRSTSVTSLSTPRVDYEQHRHNITRNTFTIAYNKMTNYGDND